MGRLRPAGAAVVLLRYLPFAEDDRVEDEVLAALVALCPPHTAADPALKKALADSRAARRAGAAFVLGRHADKAVRATVRPLLKDDDPRVRLRAAQALVAGRDPAAVPPLIELLLANPPELAWQAEELLLRIAGDAAPTIGGGDGSVAARKKQRNAWDTWWREHGDSVNLANVRPGQQQLGLTVFAQMHARKVWECGRDGKVRWAITNLAGPIDAQVLPGNRVLIAEYTGRRVTERDLQGKVLRQFNLDQPPVTCQRLANGNTFITVYTGILEVNRDGKVLYRHDLRANGVSPGHGIYGGHKLAGNRALVVTRRGSVYEVDTATGKAVHTHNVGGEGHSSVEGLPGGHFLVAHASPGRAVEYDAAGKAVWEYALLGAYHATRLPNGNTLISSQPGQRVVEVNRQGQTVWEKRTEGQVWRARRR